MPKIFSSEDDLLNIFLPILNNEEQRRLEEMEEDEADWDFINDDNPDEDLDDFEEDFE